MYERAGPRGLVFPSVPLGGAGGHLVLPTRIQGLGF